MLICDLFVAARQNRRAKLIAPIDRPHEFVFAPDVGPVVVQLLDTPAAFGRAWNLGGIRKTPYPEGVRQSLAAAVRA